MTLMLSLMLSLAGTPAQVEHVGQLVCSECWFEAPDRLTDPYGTPSDLACAARCAKQGVPPALAVKTGDGFELWLLEGDRDWLPMMGRYARVSGVAGDRDGKRVLRVDGFERLESDPWAPDRAAVPAAELRWTDLGGHPVGLDSYRGRVVVLNFWATWCAPCRKEMPDLVRIQNRYGIYGVQVVAASADPPLAADAVAEFAVKHKLNFPVLLGADTAQMQSLGAGVALPATIVLDREGRVVERISGVFDRGRLESLLDRLVGGDPHRASADPHDHGEEGHHHPPHGGTQASLVPS